MNLVEKLRLRGQSKVSIVNPPEGYVESLGVNVDSTIDPTGWFQVFVTSSSQLEGYLEALSLAPDAIGWISYPKARQLRPVTQISIDDTWSALRIKQLS